MSTPVGGYDWVALQAVMQHWVVGGSQLPAGSVYWDQQDAPKAAEPSIAMRLYTQTPMSEPWLDRDVNPLVVTSKTVTAVSTIADTLTVTAHGLVTGDGPLQFTTSGVLPGGLPVTFWAFVVDANTLKVCSTFAATGGNFVGNPTSFVNITSAGTGTLTLASTASTRRAGQELLYIARSNGRCTLNLTCFTSAAVGMGMAFSVLASVAARRPLPSQQVLLRTANIGIQHVEHVRAVHGVRNALMFEPRAIMQIHFSIPSEVSETGTIIQAVKGQNLITGKPFSAP